MRRDETPNAVDQRVELTREFWLSDREVTVGLFTQFVESVGAPGSEYRKMCPADEIPEDWKWDGEHTAISPTANHPVQQVAWDDAVRFCNWLSRRDGRRPCYVASPMGDWTLASDANGYRLPTEAEWEYACRAGTMTPFNCGSDEAALKRYAVFGAGRAAECGTRMPNTWGLFDMHGNVWEWCQDWYEDYGAEELVVDPPGPEKGSDRVYRGGGWNYSAGYCRSAYRNRFDPSFRRISLGFRVALSPSGLVQSRPESAKLSSE